MKTKLLIALVVTGLATTAWAGFVDQSANNPFSKTTQVRLIGAERFEDLPGFARDVALHEALEQIVPRRYTVRMRGIEPLASSRVSWQGGKQWHLVLREVLAQVPQIQAEIDADSRIVTFTLMSGLPAASPAAVAGPGDTAASAPLPPPIWHIDEADSSVMGVMTRWSAEAGWQLVWELEVDYPLHAQATVTGSFEEACETLITSLQAADVPPKLIIYRGNRVVRIVARGTN